MRRLYDMNLVKTQINDILTALAVILWRRDCGIWPQHLHDSISSVFTFRGLPYVFLAVVQRLSGQLLAFWLDSPDKKARKHK